MDCAKHAARVLVAGLSGDGAASPHDATPFAPLPSFWSDQVDVRVQSFGLPGVGDGVRLLGGDPDSEDGDVVYGYYLGERMIGVVALGGARAVGMAGRYRAELMALPEAEPSSRSGV